MRPGSPGVTFVLLTWAFASYVNLRVAHAPGMPGTFSPASWVSNSDMHHGTYVTHVSWCMPGSLSSGFLWSRRRGKRSRYSRRMHNPQFYVSGKRSMKENPNYKIIFLLIINRFLPLKLFIGKLLYILQSQCKSNYYFCLSYRGFNFSEPLQCILMI